MKKAFYIVYIENSDIPMPFIKYENLYDAEKEAKRVQYGTGRNVWILKAVNCIIQKGFEVIKYE